jgi:site-specific DNA recombinase
MKIIGYARVSGREQADNSHALEQQIERLKAAGAEEVYVDIESGYKGRHRPQLQKVLELVKRRAIGEVIITRLDRLSRKGVQSFAIFEDFLKAGVALRALDEPFDLTTPSGRMTAGLLVVVAQHHSDQKAESVRHGWKHLRTRKVAMNPPFGYTKVNNQHQLDYAPFLCLLATQEEKTKAAIARELVETFLEKRTLRMVLRTMNEKYGIQWFAQAGKGGRVAQALFRFSPGGLGNWLTNPVLQGHVCYLRKQGGKKCDRSEWHIHYNTHPEHRIISDEEACQIDEILEHNRRVKGFGSTALKYPLSGLIFCGECRSACYSCAGNRGKTPGYNYYFQCKNWRPRACGQKRVIRMEVCEKAVIDQLVARSEAIASAANVAPEQSEPLALKELRSQLAQLQAIPSPNQAIISARNDLQRQISSFQVDMKLESEAKSANQELLLAVFQDSSFWDTYLTPQQKQDIYRKLVDRVVVLNGQVVKVLLKV